MSKQPKALVLANWLENKIPPNDTTTFANIATELRRLHEVNQELVEALKIIFPNNLSVINKNVPDAAVIPIDFIYGELRKVAAAIAKATGESNE